MTLRYPRPASLGKLGPGHNVVESSAGTGKTYLLEHLFVDLVLNHGIPADQILVVTFTEKAAAELVLRVRGLVAELAELRPDHPKAIAAKNARGAECWVIDDQAKQLLGEARLAFGRASISTIHAFCQRVLREHAFAQGRLFDEELVDAKAVFGEAFHEVLRTRVATEPGLRAFLGAWLRAGGTVAGLGKLLWTCDEKDAEVLRPELDEARLVAAIAAWQPVADDDAGLKKRLKPTGLHGNTINAMVRRFAAVSAIITACAGDTLSFLARLHAEAGEGLAQILEKLADAKPSAEVTALARQVRELREAAVPLPAVAAQLLLPVVRERAAARKRASGHYDYTDMLKLVASALADPDPAGRALLAALRARYRHGLIDEFQDTDRIQWPIFRRIFVEAADARHGLTVVGDPKQAIYGFRGADVHTYLAARQALLAAGAQHLDLTENFRSTGPLVAAINQLCERPGFFREGSGIAYTHPVTCARPERSLVSATQQPEPPVVVFRLQTTQDSLGVDQLRDAVAGAIVEEVRRLIHAESPLRLRDGDEVNGVDPRGIFILTFTNKESFLVGDALGRAGIRYCYYKLGQLFASPEAAEIRDVLRALCAPEDRDLRAKALLTGFFGLDLATIAALPESGGDHGPAQVLRRLASEARRADVPAFFASLVDWTGVIRRQLWQGDGERALTNILHVLELLQTEWTRTHAALPELVELLDAYVRETAAPAGNDTDLQRLPTDEKAVQILTIHKAKGLEADVVFLFGGLCASHQDQVHIFHEREKPARTGRAAPPVAGRRALYVGTPDGEIGQRVSEEAADEQSRVHYVALTRARYRLYLPHYPPQFDHLDGAYAPVNGHLTQLLDNGTASTRSLFAEKRIDCPMDEEQQAAAAAARPAGTEMPPSLLVTPAVPADVVTIREQRAGFRVTSYTAVKRARSGLVPGEEATERIDPGEPHAGDQHVADPLPGGAETGIFLHEILARVTLGDLASAPAFPAWFARPEVADLLARQGRRHGRPASEIEPAARLVHTAYTAPVRLGESVIPGLATAKSALRESEFLYPMPERGHPLLSRPSASGLAPTWKIERGAVKGFIDLLFEHEGRVYVCDWKSDVLPSYDAAALAHHCEQHYEVQARLYVIAALRLCGIADPAAYGRRFGAVLFCFLRGRRPGGESEGMLSSTPTWQDILAWETEMLGQPFWGLAR